MLSRAKAIVKSRKLATSNPGCSFNTTLTGINFAEEGKGGGDGQSKDSSCDTPWNGFCCSWLDGKTGCFQCPSVLLLTADDEDDK